MIAGFDLGCSAPLLVRQEKVVSRATAANGGSAGWRLFYASDLHLTTRRESLVTHLVAAARATRPDVVLLGGDLLDRRSAAPVLTACVARLAALAPVAAVPGNHEVALGVAIAREAVLAGEGKWLPDAPLALLRTGHRPLSLLARTESGPQDALRVLVGHHPAAITAAARTGFDLVLAGHLHGGQCVRWQRETRLYPGTWLRRWNGLRFTLDATILLVSRGAADTLPIRFRCPREVLLCQVS